MTSISGPFNVRSGSSPVWRMDQLARAAINWSGSGPAQKCDAVFNAFIRVFREQNWKYTAGGAPIGVAHLLGGVTTAQQLEREFPGVGASLDCGRLRNMLKLAMEAIVGGQLGFGTVDVNNYFLTKKLGTAPAGVIGNFSCIDTSVTGNVKKSNTTYQTEQRCLFINHYALRVGSAGKIYDPCLTSTYQDVNSIIEFNLKQETSGSGAILVQDGGNPPARFQAVTSDQPTGFSAGYLWL